MLFYIGKVILTSFILWLSYILFLEKETIHKLKRIYLLSAILFSIALPLLPIGIEVSKTLTVYNEPISSLEAGSIYNGISVFNKPSNELASPSKNPIPEINFLNKGNLFTTFYFLVVCLMIIRLIKSLAYFQSLKKQGEIVSILKNTICYHKNVSSPFSFLGTIYLPASANTPNANPEEILLHESVHVKQGHSWDIIFLEVIKCIFWFNPVWYLYKKAIQLNHEFLADSGVVSVTRNYTQYQYLLLNYKQHAMHTKLTSSFNFITMKKRILMLKKTSSLKTTFANIGIVISVILITTFLFGKYEIIAQKLDKPNAAQEQLINETDSNGVTEVAFNKFQKNNRRGKRKKNG